MKTLRLMMVATAVCAALASGLWAEEKKIDAKLLAGKWEVTKADVNTLTVGTVVDFGKDNKYSATGTGPDGKSSFTATGTYAVDGDTITLTMKKGDMERRRVLTIKSLSDDKMVVTGDQGTVEFGRKK